MTLVANELRVGKDFRMPARAKVYAKRPAPIKAIQMNTEFSVESAPENIYGGPGDYLIRNAQGELSIMKKEEFEKTYEAITIGSH